MKPKLPLPTSLKRWLREGREDWLARRFEQRARDLAERPRPHRRALVLPAAGPGSLGDEAMLMASGQVMRAHGIDQLTILSYGKDEAWSPVGEFDDVISIGHRYSSAFWQSCQQVLEALASVTHLLIQGADVMDGYYSPYESFRRATYARMAVAAGIRTTIGGFSFNDHPHPRSVRILDALPTSVRLVARDPISRQRLSARLGRPVHAGADMAFLLEPAADGPEIGRHRAWIDGERAQGRRVLGVNANYLVAPGQGARDPGADLAAAYAAGLSPLLTADSPASFLLIPHDHRAMAGRYTDLDLLEALAARLPDTASPHVRLVRERLDAAEVKNLAGRIDAVVSGRMHLVIAALGQGVPAAGVTYQGKFEGLYELFELDGLCLPPSDLLGGKLTEFALGLLNGQARHRETIMAHLPRVRELAWVNFANLLEPGEAVQ